jgi:hypothetical protein
VLRLLGDPQFAEQIGRRGRVIAAGRFSPDAMVDGVVGVYRQVSPAARQSHSARTA